MRKPAIGTISEGTLRTEDLLQAFADELTRLQDGEWHMPNGLSKNEETMSFLVTEYQDRLNELAPPYCYFGSLEGDGADFGFWPDDEAIQELIANGTFIKGSRIYGDAGEYINVEEGVYIQVSDHGNVTISTLGPGETLLAIV